MKDKNSAKDLATCMVDIGNSFGKNTAAIITNMDLPLGYNIGNALEVKEAINVLKGDGPDDLKEVCVEISSLITSLSLNKPIDEMRNKVEEVLSNGVAYKKFLEWVSSQGANTSVFDDLEEFCKAKYCYDIVSMQDGFIVSMDAEIIGKSSVVLGAGRNTKEAEIDFSAGIVLLKKTGDKVTKGETIAKMYSSVINDFSVAKKMYLSALKFSKSKVELRPLIIDKIVK